MAAVRWIFFIPGGIVMGFLFAAPALFLYIIVNSDDVFFVSLIRNGAYFYYMSLSMAWIAPSSFGVPGFKTFISILFGVVVAFSSMALLRAQGGTLWEYSGEVLGAALGYLAATRWDRNSLPVLMANTKGAFPWNSYSKKPEN